MTARRDEPSPPPDTCRRLGALAVELGHVEPGALEECLREQHERSAAGEVVLLGQILLSRRLVDGPLLADLLGRQVHEAARPPAIPGYTLKGKLGEGGEAEVHLAIEAATGRTVAIKFLHDPRSSEHERKRLLREGRALASIVHPNIVALHAIGEVGRRPYLVLELVQGTTLKNLMGQRCLGHRVLARILAKVARAVGCAHRHGIVHRDLTPRNVLMTYEGEPKVVDFGLARSLDGLDRLTDSGQVVGTPRYMAPELVGGVDATIRPAADIYALGAMLYQGLTGRAPHEGDSIAEVIRSIEAEVPPAPTSLRPDVPLELELVTLRALARDPAERYGSAEEFAEDLDRFLAGVKVRARPASRRWRRLLSDVVRRIRLAR